MQHLGRKPTPKRKSRKILRLLTVPVAFAALTLSAPDADAATVFDFGELSCTQTDQLLITAPIVFRDGHEDAAVPEIFIWTSSGWQSWFTGSPLVNTDVNSGSGWSGSAFRVGGVETDVVRWYNPYTGVEQAYWHYYLPSAHGRYVMVKMWYLEGSTNQLTAGWTTAWGGTGSYCRIWNYAR